MSASRILLFDLAPEFETTVAAELALVDRFLGYAASEMCSATWGTLYSQAACLLAAHKMKLRQRSAAGVDGSGPVSAQKVGDWSLSFQYGGVANVELRSTQYGMEFLRLRNMLAITPVVVDEQGVVIIASNTGVTVS